MTCCIVSMSGVLVFVFCTVGVAAVEKINVFIVVGANQLYVIKNKQYNAHRCSRSL